MRFVPEQDDRGRWGVLDTKEGYPLVSGSYPTRDGAEAYADRLNAIDEGEPDSVVADLRRDSDALR